jgi:GTP-binding protein
VSGQGGTAGTRQGARPAQDTQDELTPREIEAGRVLFAQACTFLGAAADESWMPGTGVCEVAFAGRSNVGKSSLVNALTGRKTLARTSNTPGRTRQLNFFDLGGRLVLTDLPGYGYARAAKTEVARWSALSERYLKGRPQLRRVLLLIDARHGLKDSDRALMSSLDVAAVSYQVVFTKADKPTAAALAKNLETTGKELARHAAAHPDIAVTSAQRGTGIAELRATLAAFAEDVAAPREEL